MTKIVYSPDEDAVLEPFVAAPVTNWRHILSRLDRSERSAKQRLHRLRRAAGTLWRLRAQG